MRNLRLWLTAILLVLLCVGGVAAEEIDYLPGGRERVGRFLLLVEDVTDPLPDSDVTADDFIRRGFLLFDSHEALRARVNHETCWVGSLGVAEEGRKGLSYLNAPDSVPAGVGVFHVGKDGEVIFQRFEGITVKASYSSLVAYPFTGVDAFFHFLDSRLEEYPCMNVAAQKIVIEAKRAEGERYLDGLVAQRGRREGSGGILLVEDVNRPVPYAPYTADDFAAAGIRLVTSLNQFSYWLEGEDPCFIGVVDDPEILFNHPIVYLRLINDELGFLYIHSLSGNYVYGSFPQLVSETTPTTVPNLQSISGEWRSLESVVEAMGCAGTPSTADPASPEPTPAVGVERFEYKAVSIMEDVLIALIQRASVSEPLPEGSVWSRFANVFEEVDESAYRSSLLGELLSFGQLEAFILQAEITAITAEVLEATLNAYADEGWRLVSLQDGVLLFERLVRE